MISDITTQRTTKIGQKPFSAFIKEKETVDFFTVYLEFILYRTKTDAESYHHAAAIITERKVKDFLYAMIDIKTVMFDTLSIHRKHGSQSWLESTFGEKNSSHSDNALRMLNGKEIKNIHDALFFAYRREYQNLSIYEKVSRSDHDATIRSLLGCAAENERQQILFIDTKLSEYQLTPCELTVPSFR